MNKELMAQYGEVCVQEELLQSRKLELKRKIQEELNKPQPKVEDKKE